MSTTDPIRGQYSQHNVIYKFKSKSNSHLSLKIFRADGEKKITFTTAQLEKITFQQKMITQEADLPKFLEMLVHAGFLSKEPDSATYSPIAEGGLAADNPLKPLEENPLKGTHPGGFCLGIGESHPYYQAHPEWCKAVQSTSLSIQEAVSYQRKLKECKHKMALQDVEEKLSQLEQGYLVNIDRAIDKIVREADKKAPEEAIIHGAIQAIYENSYQLLVKPVKDMLHYMQSFYFFALNQTEFRAGLTAALPTPIQTDYSQILTNILKAMERDDLEKVEEKLIKNYPDHEEMIKNLALTARSLIEQMLLKAEKEIQAYWEHPEVSTCFGIIFSASRSLFDKYNAMLEGRYSSIKEASRDLPISRIYYASYIPKISFLLKGCEAFKSSSSEIEVKAWKLKDSCQEYLKLKNSAAHFQVTIQPLLMFWQCIKNILLWPKTCEMSEGEINYVIQNLYFLIGISNKNLTDKSLIPYEFLSLSEQDQKNAQAALKRKDLSLSKKREACRTLFHARIPWAALQAIGSLLHRSGGMSESLADENKKLVRSALYDLIQDLPTVEKAIEELIEFETSEFSSNPYLSPPAELSQGCYTNIYLLGNFSDVSRNFKKLEEVLGFWNNRPLATQDFAAPKVKYAILRTIQILGEISKNIGNVGVLSQDPPIWNRLEKLRNLLSHPEIISIYKKFVALIDDPERKSRDIFVNIFEDFRTLREYFHERKRLFDKLQTWTDRKQAQQGKNHQTDLELKGLLGLYVLVAGKLSRDQKLQIQQTVEQQKAKENREIIKSIKEKALNNVSSITEDELKQLPLSKNQKRELDKARKSITSPKAAQNNARMAKESALKLIKVMIKACKENKVFASLNSSLDDFGNIAIACESSIDTAFFNENVLKLRNFLIEIKKNWKNQEVQFSELKTIENELPVLSESVQDFIERKKLESTELINLVPIYTDLSQAQEKAQSFIDSIELDEISEENLLFQITALGITDPEAIKLWRTSIQACKKAPPLQNIEQKDDEENLIETYRKQVIDCIKTINNILGRLDALVRLESKGLNGLQQDPLLQLACEHLVSAFRAKASLLESRLESIRHLFPFCHQFFQTIQEQLTYSIGVGNDILHVHEVTEPSSATPYGKIFHLQMHIQQLLLNMSTGKERNVFIDSLHRNLSQLKEFLSQIEIAPPIRKKDLILNELETQFSSLAEKNTKGLLEVEDILDFQDRLSRALPFLQGNKKYEKLIEEAEVLVITVLASEPSSHSSSSTSKALFKAKASFIYDEAAYVIRPTKGEGSCAIHALLGEEINGIYRFPGGSVGSSEAAKAHFTTTLLAALNTNTIIQNTFSDVIKGYLNQSPEKDLSAAMLYYNTKEGVFLKQQWIDLRYTHQQEIEKIDVQQASLWLPLLELKNSPILDQIMVSVAQKTDPSNRYYQKSREEIHKILKEKPIFIFDFINENSGVFLNLIKNDANYDNILNLRDLRRQQLQKQEDQEKEFILSGAMVNHYIKTVKIPSFYLNTNEIKLAAELFNKNVVIVAPSIKGVEPSEFIECDLGGELIVIHHQGEHFSRCENL